MRPTAEWWVTWQKSPRATVDLHFLRVLCERAGVPFLDEWVATDTYCPVSRYDFHTVGIAGDQIGTADANMPVDTKFGDTCTRCGFRPVDIEQTIGRLKRHIKNGR